MTGGVVESTGGGRTILGGTATINIGQQAQIKGEMELTGDRAFNVADGAPKYDILLSANLRNRRAEKGGAGGMLASGNNALLQNTAERQTVTVPGTVTSFNLVFQGFMTAPIAGGAPLADVKAALEALPNIGKDNILMGGTTAAYQVNFVNGMSGWDVPRMIGNVRSGTGAITVAAAVAERAGTSPAARWPWAATRRPAPAE